MLLNLLQKPYQSLLNAHVNYARIFLWLSFHSIESYIVDVIYLQYCCGYVKINVECIVSSVHNCE